MEVKRFSRDIKLALLLMIMDNKSIQRRFIKRRKEQGLCLKCGKTLDRDGTYCVKCRKEITEDTNEARHFMQSIGICPRCQKEKLFGDEKVCPECSAKAYSLKMRSEEKLGKEHYNKIHAEWAKKEHHKRIEQGICTRCGKRKPDNGFKTCGICRAKDQKRREKYKKPDRSERHLKGLCYFCDNPIKDGYKVCEKHYQINVKNANCENAKKARKKLEEQGVLY